MPDLIGQRIDTYEIVALLGTGGMAEVYHARQTLGTGVSRDVAIKLIYTRLASTPEYMARCRREAQTLMVLRHPHILKAFDFGEYRDSVYLVTELLVGGSLAQLMANGPLTFQMINQLLVQIGSALDYAHKQAVIHRDLKPQNVLLDGEGNAFLTDFGIAKLLRDTTALTDTKSGLGTPAYMAPEQWQGGKIDGRADLYALGVILFEMITGALPFNADTPASMMYQHLQEPPPSAHNLRPGLPSGIDAVLGKALAKDKEQRFSSANELVTAFKAALSGEGYKSSDTQLGSTTEDILVITNDQDMRRVVPLDRRGMRIGSASDNEIVLPGKSVSYYHAAIGYNPVFQTYTLTDLDSQNGTYIGEVKILANMQESWWTEQPAQLGDFRLEWQPAHQNFASYETKTALDKLAVKISIEPSVLNVTPGGMVKLLVRLLNESELVQHYIFRSQQVPLNWSVVPPEPIQLNPGMSGQAIIAFSPPREPASSAGSYPFRIQVISTDGNVEVGVAHGVLSVLPYLDISADFQPKHLTMPGFIHVILVNNGNTTHGVTLACRDRENALLFLPATHQFVIEPGKTEDVAVSITERRRVWFGYQHLDPIEISVNPAGTSPRLLNGEFILKPRYPWWVVGVASLLCFTCIMLARLIIPSIFAPTNPTNTVVAALTSITPTTMASYTPSQTLSAIPSIISIEPAISQSPTGTTTPSLTFTLSDTSTPIRSVPPASLPTAKKSPTANPVIPTPMPTQLLVPASTIFDPQQAAQTELALETTETVDAGNSTVRATRPIVVTTQPAVLTVASPSKTFTSTPTQTVTPAPIASNTASSTLTSAYISTGTTGTLAAVPNTRLVAYAWKGSIAKQVAFFTADGHIHELDVIQGADWTHADLTSLTGAPLAAPSSPLVGYAGTGGNTKQIAYFTPDGHIHELDGQAAGWTHTDLTSLTGAPPAALGSPLVGYPWEARNAKQVAYFTTNGHIHELSIVQGTGWTHTDLTSLTGAPPAALGSPLIGYVLEARNTKQVAYFTSDGHIHELAFVDRASWTHTDLTSLTGSPAAAPGSPLAGYAWETNLSKQVAYFTADGHIHELVIQGTGWTHTDLTRLTGAPSAAPGSPLVGYAWAGGDSKQVAYFTADGHLDELAITQRTNWIHIDLTSAIGAPSAAPGSPLVGYAWESGNSKETAYFTADGHIHELDVQATGWTHTDLTSLTGAPPAVR
ncbi:MAG: protein kinase domain-containing protein [Aggregatilineales bacterium]